MTKTGSLDGDGTAGDVITYEFTIENTGSAALSGVELSDAEPALGRIDYVWPDSTRPGVLEPGEIATATADYTVTQQDVDAGGVDNTATAAGAPDCVGCRPVDDSANATTPLERAAAIDLTKTAETAGDVELGDEITYQFTVTNTGNVTLTDVTLDDDLDGLSELSWEWPDPTRPGTLAPGETATASATYTVTEQDVDNGEVRNRAFATATAPDGVDNPTDDASIAVPVHDGDEPPGDEPDQPDQPEPPVTSPALPVTGFGAPFGPAGLGVALLALGAWMWRRHRRTAIDE